MKGLCAAILGLLVVTSPAQANPCKPRTIVDRVTHIRDGDTFVLGDLPIRLHGIAAPELRHDGGLEAALAMSRMIDGRQARCVLNGERTYDRCTATCFVDGVDVGGALVRLGFARDCPRYSLGAYEQQEREAVYRGVIEGYPLPWYCEP